MVGATGSNQTAKARSTATAFAFNASTGTVSTSSFSASGTDQNITANESGTSTAWRARILSKNSAADKAAFLGVYTTSPGVFAHNHALNAWADLYVNTTSGSDGGNVYIAGGANVAIGGVSASYKLDVTGSIRATTQLLSTGNLTAWNTTTPATGVGGLHLGAASGTSNVGPAITFGARDASSGTNAQAGIYINSDGTYGTRMYFATTDSYATGSKTAMSISEAGVVNFTRATPTSGGNTIWHQGNDGSGSGLDADLLDGNDSAYFLNTSSTAQTKTAALTLNQILIPGTVGSAADSQPTALSYGRLQGYGDFYINANTDASGTEYLILTAGYSVANGTAANGMAIGQSTLTWKNNTIWHGGNDGAGSGLDADLLDGYSSATTATGNTIVLRDANGDDYRRYGFGSYFNSTDDVSAGTLTYLMGKFGDNYYRSATAAKVATFISGQTMDISGTSSSAPLLSSLGNYAWTSASLPNTYSLGITNSFVGPGSGEGLWQSYGSVMNMRTYSGGGGSLQLYVPYSPTYGGTGLQVRFGNYDVSSGNSWTSWKTLLASDNYTGYSAFTGIVSSGTGTSGGFQNVTYAAGRNRIWSFGNADAYGLSYFQGGPDYIGLHFGTATQAASQFWVSDSGISQTSASSRAPLFYDSDDTGYYLNPNSTADSALRIRGGALHGPNVSWGAYLLVGGDGRQNYTDNTSVASVCTTNGNLHIDSASGFETYLNFYDGTIVKFGSGANTTVGSINSSGHASFPIYYDYNDTAYYTDPNSTSRIVSAIIGGHGGNAYDIASSGRLYFGTSADNTYSIYTHMENYGGNYTKLTLDWHTGIKIGAYYGYGGIRFYNNSIASSGTEVFSIAKGDNHVRVNYNLYAPIFYDSDNAAYYTDPASTSNLNGLTVASTITVGGAIVRSAAGVGYLSGNYSSSETTSTSGAIYTIGGSYVPTSTTLGNMYGIGYAYAAYGGVSAAWGLYVASNGIARIYLDSDNGISHATGSHRAPIFYDRDNTGYYTDPASTSVLNNVQVLTFGVGTAASGTTGEIRATNNVTAYYSDERLKENITTISSALSKLLKLRGVTFNSNEIAEQYGYTDKKEQVGVIAQDVEKVLPQVVVPAPFDIAQDEDGNEYSKSGENYKTVHYDKLVPLLIEAIKELKGEIEELKSKIST
jgi:hypothetical protein